MEDQGETKKEERIKVVVSYNSKKAAFSANVNNNLRITLDNLIKLAKADPERYWDLPEVDANGQRLIYRLGKESENTKKIFRDSDEKREEKSLKDYGVMEGDVLILVQKVMAG